MEKRQKPIRLWLVPRGFYKTSLFNVAHNIILLLNNPAERIMIGSAVLANSKDMVSETGDVFIRNELFRQLYPEWCPENPKMPDTTWSRGQIELPNRKDFAKMEKSIEAHGSDTSVVSRHYTYMKFDDLVAPGYFETSELRKKMKDYFKACLSLKDMPNTPIDVMGTPWHDDTVYEEIEKWDEVETIKIPAEYFDELGVRQSIFPEIYPIETLDQYRKSQGSYLYSALYLMNPIPDEMQLFKKNWFVYYKNAKQFDEITGYQKIIRQDDNTMLTIGNRFMTVDPAKKEGAGDYSAIIVNTTDEENNWYIVDMWRGQVNPMTLSDKIIDMYFYWNPIILGIETIAYQQMLKLYIEEKMRREGFPLNIQEIEPSTKISKEMKIKALQPMYESKCIYHPEGHQLTPVLEEELTRFPAGKNDDLIDALQMQKHLIFPSRVTKTKCKDANSLDVWKERLKRFKKDKGRFFKDYEREYKNLRGWS